MLQAVHYCGLTAAIQPDDYDPALVATEKSRTKRQQERRHDREQKLILQSPLLSHTCTALNPKVRGVPTQALLGSTHSPQLTLRVKLCGRLRRVGDALPSLPSAACLFAA